MPLILFDIISTEIALKKGGIELNPLMKNRWVRWILSLLFKIIAVIWLFIMQITQPAVYQSIEIIFIILTVIYSLIAINNMVKLIILKKGI